LPLALFAFGDSGLALAVVVFAVMLVWNFTFGLWLVSGGGAPGRLLRDPIMIASVLGVVFAWQGWGVPLWLDNALGLIGQVSIPLMLITLGVAVARLRAAGLARAAVIAALRLGLCAAVAVAVGLIFALPAQPFAVLVLQLATPVAVTSYLLAEKYGADADAVAALVIASTVLSLVTLPVTIGLLL
jgi:predicted permease